MDTGREKGAIAEQAIAVIHISVLGIGEQLSHPCDLTETFGDMRLDVDIRIIALQLARTLQQLRRGGRSEPRRHGVAQQTAAVPLLDERSTLVIRIASVLEQVAGRV